MLVVGCYTLQPTMGTVPDLGTTMGFDITDVGRVALSGPMGPEIGQVEGHLISKTDSDYVVGVTAVHFLRGGQQVWQGEPVRIKTAYVSRLYERKFSASRSVILGAIVVGTVTAIAVGSLAGLSNAPRTEGGDTSGATIRIPVRIPLRLPLPR